MTEYEWLDIGYEKGIIDRADGAVFRFCEIYKEWFLMKKNLVKPQSLDRIEVTYNKYYLDSSFPDLYVSAIKDSDIVDFLTKIIYQYGRISYKEYGRILQIVKGVLTYARDLKMSGVPLHDWDMIKRYLPLDSFAQDVKKEDAVSDSTVRELIYEVADRRIYAVKQCACLALCMNFYLGLRIGELAGLKFDDFDFERGVVKVWKTESKFYNRGEDGEKLGVMVYRVVESVKTVNSVREIPLLPEVKRFYQLIKNEHEEHGYDSPYLCYDGTDTILVRSLDRTLRRLCSLCDVTYFNTHLIRKTFATRLHFSGVPTRMISDLLGHSEIGTTENSYILSYGQNYDSVLKFMKEGLSYCEKEK